MDFYNGDEKITGSGFKALGYVEHLSGKTYVKEELSLCRRICLWTG